MHAFCIWEITELKHTRASKISIHNISIIIQYYEKVNHHIFEALLSEMNES